MNLALIGPIGWLELLILMVLALIVLLPLAVAIVIIGSVVSKQKHSQR